MYPLNSLLIFYKKLFRKEIVERLNVSAVRELDMPIMAYVSTRVTLPTYSDMSKQRMLLVYKGISDLVSGQACAMRPIPCSHRAKKRRVRKLTSGFYDFEFRCHIRRSVLLYNLLMQLYCCRKFRRKVFFNLLQEPQRRSRRFCSIRRLMFRQFPWICYAIPQKIYRRRCYFRIEFLFRHNGFSFLDQCRIQLLFKLFLFRTFNGFKNRKKKRSRK